MISNIYTVFDMTAKLYLPPMVFRNDGEALRAFAQGLKDEKSTMFQYPESFVMYKIGRYDVDSGQVEGTAHVLLGKAVDFLPVETADLSRATAASVDELREALVKKNGRKPRRKKAVQQVIE